MVASVSGGASCGRDMFQGVSDVLVATGVVSLVVGSGTAPLFDGDPDGFWQSEHGDQTFND